MRTFDNSPNCFGFWSTLVTTLYTARYVTYSTHCWRKHMHIFCSAHITLANFIRKVRNFTEYCQLSMTISIHYTQFVCYIRSKSHVWLWKNTIFSHSRNDEACNLVVVSFSCSLLFFNFVSTTRIPLEWNTYSIKIHFSTNNNSQWNKIKRELRVNTTNEYVRNKKRKVCTEIVLRPNCIYATPLPKHTKKKENNRLHTLSLYRAHTNTETKKRAMKTTSR